MFGGKKDKNNQFVAGGHTLFDHALEIHGSIRFGGTLDIEGTVIGDVVADESADAIVRVRDRGMVQGEISAPKIVINGHVTGNIYATKHLELAANAVVNGDVHYHIVEMVKGAQVNGNLVHVGEDLRAAHSEEVNTVHAESGVKKQNEKVASLS